MHGQLKIRLIDLRTDERHGPPRHPGARERSTMLCIVEPKGSRKARATIIGWHGAIIFWLSLHMYVILDEGNLIHCHKWEFFVEEIETILKLVIIKLDV